MFSAYRMIAPGRLRESVGLAFEDFEVGQVFHHRPGITVYQTDNVNEALVSLNQAAIHFDEMYASKTEFGKPLVVSTITVQRALGMGWKTFGRRKSIRAISSIRLTAPVFAGDTLYSRTKILSLRTDPDDPECGLVESEATVTRGEVAVASVTYTQAVYRRDMGPFEQLLY